MRIAAPVPVASLAMVRRQRPKRGMVELPGLPFQRARGTDAGGGNFRHQSGQ
jgi:hypothetical protein